MNHHECDGRTDYRLENTREQLLFISVDAQRYCVSLSDLSWELYLRVNPDLEDVLGPEPGTCESSRGPGKCSFQPGRQRSNFPCSLCQKRLSIFIYFDWERNQR